MQRSWLLLMALYSMACDAPSDNGDAPSDAAAPSSSAYVLHTELAGPAAFDVALTGSGAALAWSDGKSLLVRTLAADGAPGDTAVIAHASIREVAAAGDATRLAVVWLEDNGKSALVQATVRTGARFEPPAPLGPSERDRLDRRGHVAVSIGRAGRLVAFHRGLKDACEPGQPAVCASFGMHDLPASGADVMRPWLAVPAPCDGGIVGVALAGAHWHYAVCSIEGAQPTTTLFTIQSEPAYAQAQALMRGCTPLGMTVLDRDVWIVGSCGGKRVATVLRGIDEAWPSRDLSDVELRCRGERIVLATGDETTELGEPAAGVGPLLPTHIAPLGARAVWTGKALLVAYSAGAALELARYRCLGGLLLRG